MVLTSRVAEIFSFSLQPDMNELIVFFCELYAFDILYHNYASRGPVAQWIRHLTTNQGIPGSSPGRVETFYTLAKELHIPPIIYLRYFP